MKRIIVKVKYGQQWRKVGTFSDNDQGRLDANIKKEYYEILSTPKREVKIETEN